MVADESVMQDVEEEEEELVPGTPPSKKVYITNVIHQISVIRNIVTTYFQISWYLLHKHHLKSNHRNVLDT